MTTIKELPEERKVYLLELSNGRSYTINGVEKEMIMSSRSQFIQLRSGEIVNRSFMVSITLDREETKTKFLRLPDTEKRQLTSGFSTLKTVFLGAFLGLIVFVYSQSTPRLPGNTPSPHKATGRSATVLGKSCHKGSVNRRSSSSSVEDKICAVFGDDCKMAIAIAKAESKLNCSAVSSTDDHGLFQINAVHMAKFKDRSPYDCEANIEVAKEIYQSSGWYPWSVFTSGGYLKYL